MQGDAILEQMPPQSERNLSKLAEVSLFLAAAACLILFLVRVYYAISFVTPSMLATTGDEWECLFPVWKFTQHQAIYTDPHRIPFAVSLYNWGFYFFYGLITDALLHLLRLDDIWISTIGRLISVVFTFMAGGIFCLALRDFVKAGLFTHSLARWAWCLIAVLSPLIGFWSISVRPDVGALAL